MAALGRREQFWYFTLSRPPAARLRQPSSRKGASVVPVCDVSAMFLHRLVVRLPQLPAAISCPELRFPSWKRVHLRVFVQFDTQLFRLPQQMEEVISGYACQLIPLEKLQEKRLLYDVNWLLGGPKLLRWCWRMENQQIYLRAC